MYLMAGARLLLRRWIVCAAGLLLTVAGCYYVWRSVPVQHQATSQMLFLLPPAATGSDNPTNPYLNLPEGLVTTAGLVAGELSTQDSQRRLAADGDTASYTIAVVQGAGPLLAISATATDSDAALATRDELMDEVDAMLLRIQREASVPGDQVMRATRSSVSKEAEPMTGGRQRAVVGTALLGLVGVAGIAFLVDLMVGRRRRRQADVELGDAVSVHLPGPRWSTRAASAAEPDRRRELGHRDDGHAGEQVGTDEREEPDEAAEPVVVNESDDADAQGRPGDRLPAAARDTSPLTKQPSASARRRQRNRQRRGLTASPAPSHDGDPVEDEARRSLAG